jgi:hypothetical protein
MLNRNPNQNEIAIANIALYQRNHIIALSAIIASLPRDLINREVVRKNIANSPLFEGLAGKSDEARAVIEKLADQILGPA